MRFLCSVQLGLKSRAEIREFASRAPFEREAGRPGGSEKIAGGISVKSRTRVSGFGNSNFSASFLDSDAAKFSRFEIDTNVRMDSLGTETKPPEMEGTKPLPSRKASGQLAAHASDKASEPGARSSRRLASPEQQERRAREHW